MPNGKEKYHEKLSLFVGDSRYKSMGDADKEVALNQFFDKHTSPYLNEQKVENTEEYRNQFVDKYLKKKEEPTSAGGGEDLQEPVEPPTQPTSQPTGADIRSEEARLSPAVEKFNEYKEVDGTINALQAGREQMDVDPITPQQQFEAQQEIQTRPTEGIQKTSPVEENISKIADEVTAKASDERIAFKEAEQKRLDTGQGRLESFAAEFDQAILGFPGQALKSIGIAGTWLQRKAGADAPTEEDAAYRMGQWWDDKIKEMFPSNPAYQEELTNILGRTIGDLATIYASGGAAALKNVPSVGMKMMGSQGGKTAVREMLKRTGQALKDPSLAVGATQMSVPEFEQAIEGGATDDEAFEVWLKNAFTGSVLERLPVQMFAKRLNDASGGGFTNILKRGFKGGFEEGATEVLQQMYANKTAQDVYDSTRDVFEGIGESGGLGFGLGFVINALGGRLRSIKKDYKGDDAKIIDDTISLVESKKVEQEEKLKEIENQTPENKDADEEIIKSISEEEAGERGAEQEAEAPSTPTLEEQTAPVEYEAGETVELDPTVTEPTEVEPKPEKDAVQEQETGEVPVQPEAKPGEEVEEGTPTPEPEVTAKEEVPDEAEVRKAELEEKISTGKTKLSQHIQRRLKDLNDKKEFTEAIVDSKTGEYKAQSVSMANVESSKLVKDFEKEYGDDKGLNELFKITKAGHLPEIMEQQVAAKVILKMEAQEMYAEALEFFDWKQNKLRKAGRSMVGARADSSPEETVSRLFAGIERKKQEALSSEYKEGKTYKEAIEGLKTKLGEVEEAYNKLKETGKIEEGELPEAIEPKKSKEIKARAKVLRRKGVSNLKAALKKQRGKMHMGAPVDVDVMKALGQIFQSYLLEFQGNTLSAFEKFRKDVSKDYGIPEEDLKSFKSDLISQSEDVINEFKEERQLQVVEGILKPEGKETKEERKARRETAERIVEDYKKGDTKAVEEGIAALAPFEQISLEDRKDILDLTTKYGDYLAEGKAELAHNTWEDLMIKLLDLNLEKRAGYEVIQDLWYTSVLSGLTTISRSIKGSGLTTLMFTGSRMMANPKIAPFAISQMTKGLSSLKNWDRFKNYIHVLKTGRSNVSFIDEKSVAHFDRKPKYTDVIFRKKFKELSTKNKIAKAVFAVPTMVFRNIVAFDQILKNSVSEGNMAVFEMARTDKGKKISERVNEVRKRMMLDKNQEIKDTVSAEIAEMKEDGEKIETGYADRRFREIRNEMRDTELVRKATEDASVAAMVSTPKGYLGKVYNMWINSIEIQQKDDTGIKAGKMIAKSIFPFVRVSFNWINAGLDYTPLGVGRAIKGETWTKEGTYKLENYEKRELYAKSAIGLSVGIGAIMSMFDWDEEEGFKMKDKEDRWLEVYGPLTGNWWEYKDVASDAKPWSIRIKNPITGEWSGTYKYLDNPIGFMLAPIGMMHDELMFNDFKDISKEKDIKNQQKGMTYLMGMWASGTLRYAMDQSFNQGMNTVSKLMSGDKDTGKHFADLFVKPSEGFYPSIYKQMHNQYKAVRGISERQYSTWYERPARFVPFVDAIIKHEKYDVFGYPIVRDFDFPFVPDLILKTAKENLDYREDYKEWQLLHKYEEVTIGGFLADKSLSADDRDTFMRLAGEEMRKKVNRKYKYLDGLSPEKLQAKLSKYKSEASEYAKSKINK